MKIDIKSKKEYHEMMVEIYNLMNKGEGKLTKLESTKLSKIILKVKNHVSKFILFLFGVFQLHFSI